MSRKLILYIATSLEGYIAAPNDDLSFLSLVQKEGLDYGYGEFIKTVDTVILGRKTYDWVIKNAGSLSYPSQKVYVITKTERQNTDKVEFYNGDLTKLIEKLKSEPGKNIFCDGGAQIVNELLKHSLIDEFVISVVPVLLGDGIKLFQGGFPTQNLELISSQQFETGLIQLKYNLKSRSNDKSV
jgi:dihydrofolate reductase